MKCIKCKSEIKESDVYCPYCGYKVPEKEYKAYDSKIIGVDVVTKENNGIWRFFSPERTEIRLNFFSPFLIVPLILLFFMVFITNYTKRYRLWNYYYLFCGFMVFLYYLANRNIINFKVKEFIEKIKKGE